MKKLLSLLISLILIISPVLVLANEEVKEISNITIVDLYKPKENKEVNIDGLKLNNENVEVASFSWLIKTNDTYKDYKGDTFNKGETYALLLELKTSEGYKFSDNLNISFNGSTLDEVNSNDYENSGYFLNENGNVEVFILSKDMPNSFDNMLIGLAVLLVGAFTYLGNKLGNKVFNKGKVVKKK